MFGDGRTEFKDWDTLFAEQEKDKKKITKKKVAKKKATPKKKKGK
jgi:hypothetical protein